MALVATMVARALMTLNSPVRLLMPTAPVMRSPAAAHQPGDEQPVDQLHALALQREPQLPGEFEPAALRIHHAGEIEPARRPALVGALLVAAEMHAHRLEVLEPRVRSRSATAAPAPGRRCRHCRRRSRAGCRRCRRPAARRWSRRWRTRCGRCGRSARSSTSVTRVPGGPWRLADSAAIRPPAPAPTTSTSVSIRLPSRLFIRSLYRSPRRFTTAAGGSSPTDARRRCAPGRRFRS